MQTLETLKRRIESTEDLGSVVSTMKSLSAVHIRQYERAVEAVQRYARTIELGLGVVLRSRGSAEASRPARSLAKTGIVAFGSDYGLCGQFNDELVTHILESPDGPQADPADTIIAAVGARAGAALRARGRAPDHEFAAPSSVGEIESAARRVLLTLDEWRDEGQVERVLLVHHQHRSSSELPIRTTQLLPIELSRFRRITEDPWPSKRLPSFTMQPERLLASLLREFLAAAVFRAFAESAASEHASRLQSMQAAERNIEERLDELTAQFHRRRQDAITAELLDVVAGYEALSGRAGR